MRLPDDSRLRGLPSLIRELDPGTFAFIMATGIVSTALLAEGATVVSATLLIIAIVGYLVLLLASGYRLMRWPRRMWHDFTSPRGFAFLAFVAGTNVLVTRLTIAGYVTVAMVLLAIGVLGWLVLGYGVPLALITGSRHKRGTDEVTGMWFLWVVAIQSVAVASGTLAGKVDFVVFPVLASVCWAIGLVLYPVIATLVLARLLLRSITPAQLMPAYWIFMGACAITVLAGATVVNMPAQTVLPESMVVGMSFVQWSFCTWLLPLLLGLGVWRHAIRRYPLTYETGLWGMVFPIGMYGVASHQLGKASGADWLSDFGNGEGWVAVAVWLAVVLTVLGKVRGSHQPQGV